MIRSVTRKVFIKPNSIVRDNVWSAVIWADVYIIYEPESVFLYEGFLLME